MPDTKRQQIITALITALENISVANGYETNAGETVLDWPDNIAGHYEADELPIIGVFDVDEITPSSTTEEKKTTRQLTVQIRCYIRKQTKAVETRKIIGDITKSLGVDKRLGNLAIGIVPNRKGLVIESENFEISAAAVEVTVYYDTCAWNDYV